MDPEKLDFVLLLNEKGANEVNKHVPLYMKKNLMTKFDSLADLRSDGFAATRRKPSYAPHWKSTTRMPSTDETSSTRHFSRTFRLISPVRFMRVAVTPWPSTTPWAASKSTPKAACCERMDRASMDYSPPVKSSAAFTARIVSAVTRLTECAVFGRLVGASVARRSGRIRRFRRRRPSRRRKGHCCHARRAAKHASALDCWVALYGKVYDFTDFLEDHPAGADAV